ncbi:hypothetical protein A306_00000484, partial [Columba livia]
VKHNGEWGSVCNFHFDWETSWATVVCRQLGCGGVAKASVYAPFGQGTGRIWLQPFLCRGTEEMLHECPNWGWGQHYCNHERDVGVTCRGLRLCWCPGAEAVELRLVAGGGPCAGRVEAKLRGQWGSVGDGAWHMNDAQVVCRHLGCGQPLLPTLPLPDLAKRMVPSACLALSAAGTRPHSGTARSAAGDPLMVLTALMLPSPAK